MKRYRSVGKREEDVAPYNVIDGDFSAIKRADPPDDLTKSQAKLWRSIVSSEPPDFFGSEATRLMLKHAICHLDTAEQLSHTINSFKREWLKSREGSKMYDRYLKMRADETKAYAQLATKLRLTNQSRYTPRAAATTGNEFSKLRPWEEADENQSG